MKKNFACKSGMKATLFIQEHQGMTSEKPQFLKHCFCYLFENPNSNLKIQLYKL